MRHEKKLKNYIILLFNVTKRIFLFRGIMEGYFKVWIVFVKNFLLWKPTRIVDVNISSFHWYNRMKSQYIDWYNIKNNFILIDLVKQNCGIQTFSFFVVIISSQAFDSP